MRSLSLNSLLLAATALLASCAIVPPAPRTVSVSEARLAQMIGSQFPFNSEMLEVLDVNVSAPRITLDPVNNRINTSFDLGVSGQGLIGLLTTKTYQGAMDLSYGLRFEPSDYTVRMTDVRVSRFSVEGAPEVLKRPIEKLGAPLAKKLLKDYALYKLQPEDLQATEGWMYKPASFRIEPTGLSITLDPVARQ
ncbi:hypothetical protein [Propionivibrio soli]|uniref:hypothetical protein n=1 Tax=Propionivibrio soli TaxID=2976531 RepID=UPI0021E727BB|nr:hypothetical protein [Propionivibrio soli]